MTAANAATIATLSLAGSMETLPLLVDRRRYFRPASSRTFSITAGGVA